MNNRFIDFWLKILNKADFFHGNDYSVTFTIPKDTLKVTNFKVHGDPPNAKELESYLNSNLAPKMTRVLKANTAKGAGVPETLDLVLFDSRDRY